MGLVIPFSTRQSPIQISNVDFLKEVFGPTDWERAHVCGFEQDPYDLDRLGLRHYWAGGPAWRLLSSFTPEMNQYFTISVFTPDPNTGTQRRKKTLHEKTKCIVLDDIGPGTSAKVPWDRVKRNSSWVLETSPGNFQVGYILAGGGDERAGKVTALLDALVAAGLSHNGKDPGMKGVTRYVRLPEGMNRKAAYATGNSPGFASKLWHWDPNSRHTIEDIANDYGVLAEVAAAPDQLDTTGRWATGAPGSTGITPGGGEDFWLDVLAGTGTLRQELSAGVWDIECPFIDEHTARADSGSAYLGNGAFKCHHGHCESRGSEDFRQALRNQWEGTPEWEAARRAGLDLAFGDIGGSRDPFVLPGQDRGQVDAAIARVEVATRVAAVRGRFSGAFSGGAGLAPVVLGQNWLVKGLFPAEGMGVLYGPPKSGKTFVGIDLACRVAAGLDWHGHRVKRQGLVIVVSSEGGRAGMVNRVVAWRERVGVGVGAGGLDRLLVWPGALRLGRGAVDDADALITWARDTAASLGLDVALIVIDTVARNMVGDENSTEDMGEFVRAIDRVWNELGCFVLTVHHSGKDVARGLRGSSALGGASDANILVQRDKEKGLTEPGEIILEDLRHAEDGKKYGFLLEYHKLGVDEDLEDVGSLVAVPHAPPKPKVRVGKLEQAIMDTLIDVTSGDPDTLVDEKTIYDQLAVGIDNGDFEDLKKPKSNHFRDALRRLKEKALIEKQEEKWKIV